MITNSYNEVKMATNKKRHYELASKKFELEQILSSLNTIVKNKSGIIDERSLMLKGNCVSEIKEINKELIQLRAERVNMQREKESERNMALKDIFKEIFTIEQLNEIEKEAIRRKNGEHPFKLSFNIQESVEVKEQNKKYKKQIIELLDTMVAFRINLTNMIDKGCDKFGKAEFLTFISPLNRLITPTAELEKIKRKIIG